MGRISVLIGTLVLSVFCWSPSLFCETIETEKSLQNSAEEHSEKPTGTTVWEPFPKHRLIYSNRTFLTANPLGALNFFELAYRFRLYPNPHPLFKDAHIGLSVEPSFSPALAKIGGKFVFQPLSVLRLSAGYYFISWFGTFDTIQSYESANDDYSNEAQGDGDAYPTYGKEAHLDIYAAGRVGNVALENTLKFVFTELDLRNDHTLYYYEITSTLIPNEGWILINSTRLVYLFNCGLIAGAMNQVLHSFYRNKDYRPGENRDNVNTPIVRTGPVLGYIFFDKPGKRFNRPTLVLSAMWWVKHRYRAGQEFSQGIPFFLLGFTFHGTFFQSK